MQSSPLPKNPKNMTPEEYKIWWEAYRVGWEACMRVCSPSPTERETMLTLIKTYRKGVEDNAAEYGINIQGFKNHMDMCESWINMFEITKEIKSDASTTDGSKTD